MKREEKLKSDKYSQRCQLIDYDFMPMAFEIYGTCSEKFESFLKKMVTAASEVTHVPYSVLLNYWRKRFSIALQTFNARLITRLMLYCLIMVGEILSVTIVLLELLEMLSA